MARLGVIAWLLGRLVWQRNDLVIAGHPLPAGTIGNILRKWRRCRAVMILTYGEEITMYGRGSRMRKMLQRALAGAQAVVTIAECNRPELEALSRGTDAKTVVIPPAVESPPSAPALNTIQLTGQPVLFTLSRLVERKGIDTTIEAVALLRDEFPSIKYYVAGRGPDEDRLKALVERLGVGEQVVFLGPVDAPDFLYPQADIFCMPNRTLESGEREGFGMVFLEAGLHGVPSIGGRSGGAVEAVRDGETGILVNPDSPQGMAASVRDLTRNETYRRQLGAAAKLYAESFSKQKMADAFVSNVQRILDEANSQG
jgi:phosphatidylinositol alpha-1,6-mannosyltransferase